MPELILPSFRFAILLPKLVCSLPDLLLRSAGPQSFSDLEHGPHLGGMELIGGTVLGQFLVWDWPSSHTNDRGQSRTGSRDGLNLSPVYRLRPSTRPMIRKSLPALLIFASIGTVSGHGAAAERFYDAVKKTLDVVKVGRSDRWLGYGDRADPSIRTGSTYHLQGPETG